MIRKILGRLFGFRVVAVNVHSGGASARFVHTDEDGVDYVIVFGHIYRLDDLHLDSLIWLVRESPDAIEER